MTEPQISTSYHSYPSPKTIGHGMIKDLLLDEVIVEEKLDGSQFSFGIFDGELRCRSKGAQLNMFAPEKMFIPGVEYLKTVKDKLVPGYTYRAEYFHKPKHNVLAYDRIPRNHFMIIDINTGHEIYVTYEEKVRLASAIDLETTPLLFRGIITNPMMVRDFLDHTSILGGQKIEGVVIKNYTRFTMDGKVQMGKFVSEDFKEVHNSEWKKENPTGRDVISILTAKYRSPARWQKALQHLREAGKIKSEMSDLQFLFPEVASDVLAECEGEIKDLLFKWAWKDIQRSLTGGLPQWYQEQLIKNQFEEAPSAS